MPQENLVIRLEISGQTPTKKSGQMIIRTKEGNQRIIPNPRYLKWEKGAVSELQDQMRGREAITMPVSVTCLIWRTTWRRVDLANLCQSIHDVLEKAGVIENDFLIESMDGSRRILGAVPGEERAEIYIEHYVKEQS